MPKFTRLHLIWIALAVIVALYIFFPGSGIVENVFRPIFHAVFNSLLGWFG